MADPTTRNSALSALSIAVSLLGVLLAAAALFFSWNANRLAVEANALAAEANRIDLVGVTPDVSLLAPPEEVRFIYHTCLRRDLQATPYTNELELLGSVTLANNGGQTVSLIHAGFVYRQPQQADVPYGFFSAESVLYDNQTPVSLPAPLAAGAAETWLVRSALGFHYASEEAAAGHYQQLLDAGADDVALLLTFGDGSQLRVPLPQGSRAPSVEATGRYNQDCRRVRGELPAP
ncbi:MAG: hypothetical protein R3272_14755 [Candidatus Promineifilaceae bacterium]|nr:hypothetical protein [Candidatus Promineifilaceae bacterium]